MRTKWVCTHLYVTVGSVRFRLCAAGALTAWHTAARCFLLLLLRGVVWALLQRFSMCVRLYYVPNKTAEEAIGTVIVGIWLGTAADQGASSRPEQSRTPRRSQKGYRLLEPCKCLCRCICEILVNKRMWQPKQRATHIRCADVHMHPTYALVFCCLPAPESAPEWLGRRVPGCQAGSGVGRASVVLLLNVCRPVTSCSGPAVCHM